MHRKSTKINSHLGFRYFRVNPRGENLKNNVSEAPNFLWRDSLIFFLPLMFLRDLKFRFPLMHIAGSRTGKRFHVKPEVFWGVFWVKIACYDVFLASPSLRTFRRPFTGDLKSRFLVKGFYKEKFEKSENFHKKLISQSKNFQSRPKKFGASDTLF